MLTKESANLQEKSLESKVFRFRSMYTVSLTIGTVQRQPTFTIVKHVKQNGSVKIAISCVTKTMI